MSLTGSKIPHLELTISLDESDLLKGAAEIISTLRPRWNLEHSTFKLFTDGITNKLVGCFNSKDVDDVVLVRVYGQNTDLLIDRKAETRNFILLQDFGYAPQLYATFHNGLVYEFVPGEVLTVGSVRSPAVYPLVARVMAGMHHVDCGPHVARQPALWDKVNNFLALIPDRFHSSHMQKRFEEGIPGGLDHLRRELCVLQAELSQLGSPIVFCHNDLLLANVIHRNTSTTPTANAITFIDYEYAAYNYQAFDIGNHFDEFAGVTDTDFSLYPERSFQLSWLRVYLEEYKRIERRGGVVKKGEEVEEKDKEEVVVTEEEVERLYVQVNKFALAAHFMWGVWAFVQAQHSTIDFNFLEYGIVRLKEYFARRDEFLSLQLSR
ncbi:ethanolamine kinase 1 [Nilaparvata lugens]|uniref:ethanolamine kinase 1 n=1 Tax=Nilaparvata lugens TaxID=108931 RepID=UPI000B98FDCD|nr:ethanolamine kinase 1 [Nilaparvata lugens]XP_022198573.1 ethanolamine kinase 1 [Nilaparvata lugens]